MDFFKGLSDRYNEIWQNIVSPQRQVYFLNDLGPKVQIVRKVPVIRYDLDIKNSRGQNIKCTFYAPEKYDKSKIGCVIYLHGNAGSRIEALTTFNYLLPRTTLFCFDFAGAGKSEGDYVTLGVKEAEDLALMVEYVKKNLGIQKIALWGRSMGAATAINYCSNHPKEVCALALDSGFIKLSIILEEIGKQRTKIPSFLVDTVLLFIKNKITNVLNLDIFSLDLVEQIKKIKNIGGIIFCSADKDTIINSYHTQKLYEAFNGEKQHIKFEGDHNTHRPPLFFKAIVSFLETRLYGQEMAPLPTLAEDEQNNIQIKDISFNSEDQFVHAMQLLPTTLDKTDQLVEMCIKQMENLANPYQPATTLTTQTSNDKNITCSSSVNIPPSEYYFAQKYNQENDGYSYREKLPISNMNCSLNNTKRIKQMCTNVNNNDFNNSFQQSYTNQGQIVTLLNHQKKKSITQRNDITHSQQMPTIQSQDFNNGVNEVRKSDNTFSRKPTNSKPGDLQGINVLVKTQINTCPDEGLDKQKEDILKRIFDEIDVFPAQNKQTPAQENRNFHHLKLQDHQAVSYPNQVQNNRYQEVSRSPNKVVDFAQYTENNQQIKQRNNTQQQQYMMVDFVQQETKEPGRSFPSKLLKQNLFNENNRKETQKDNIFASSNQGQIQVTAQDKFQRENSYKNLQPLQQKQPQASPISQNIQQFNKGGSTPNEKYLVHLNNLSNLNVNLYEDKKLFSSFIDQSEGTSNQNYSNKHSNSPFDKKTLENSQVIKRNVSFKDFLIEESENLEEGLTEKEPPKHSANVKTLQEIRGIDNRNEKQLPSIQQSAQTNEQRILQLINKYRIQDVSSSPSSQLDKKQGREEDILNDQNKQQSIIQLNDLKQKKLQQIVTQPVKQIQVTLHEPKQKVITPSQVLQLQQQHKYQGDPLQLNQKSPHNHLPLDIQSFRRATLDTQNTQLNKFSQEQHIKFPGNNNQAQQLEQSRFNNHMQFHELYPSSSSQISNTAVIGNKINLHSSNDRNQKNQQKDNNQMPLIQDHLISTKNKQVSNIEIPQHFDNSTNLLTNQQHRQGNHPLGIHRHSLNNPQFLQKAQFDQAYQNAQAINFKNIQHNQVPQSNNLQNQQINSQNSQSGQNSSNPVSTSSTQLRGISLLSKQQSIQSSNSNQPTPSNQMTKQNMASIQSGNMIIYRHHPEENKQVDASLKSGLQGVQILQQNQNIHESSKQVSNSNQQMFNSRNQSPNVYQVYNMSASQNQLHQQSPNLQLQKKMNSAYVAHNSPNQQQRYGLEKYDHENNASQSRMVKSNINYNYSNSSSSQQQQSSNTNFPENNGDLMIKGIESSGQQYGNIQKSPINASSITQQSSSSHISSRIDQQQQQSSRLPQQQNIQIQPNQYLNKNPVSFNYQINTDSNNYYNSLQYQNLNRSPKNQNINLSKLQGQTHNENLNSGQGTDRSYKN